MSYYIDLIDTTSPLVRLTHEIASGGGIELVWNGSDKKDGLGVVSTELNFEMLDPTHQDAAFADFYTGNETRFRVELRLSSDDSILWQGHILPDLYNEPYKNGALFVGFTATDGLARIKGKYLPDEFYDREKSVVAIFSQVLKLTGLQLDLYFAPAIENTQVKDWNLIYIDTAEFSEGGKKKDAYSIFEKLVIDKVCVCYQADNRWYIEGINIRNQRKVYYKNYDYNGNFIGTVVYDRLVKQITPLVTPYIDITPPYNEIRVSHKKTVPGLAKTVSKSVPHWALLTGVVGEIYPNDWMGNNGYYGRCTKPNYETTVYSQDYFTGSSSTVWPQDDTKYIALAKKLYFSDKDKVKIKMSFEIVHPATGTAGSPSTWNNVMKYQIIFNGAVLYSNVSTGGGDVVEDRENLIFSSGGSCTIEIDHIFDAEGLLDIKLFRPIGRVSDNGVLGVRLSQAEIGIIDFNEEVSEVDLINDDFTVDAELDLDYADDKTGISKSFRLAKLKEYSASFNEIEVYILYGFVFEGKNYAVVQLDGAELISKNPYAVTYGGNPVLIIDVIFNFNGIEQMVVQTVDLYSSGSFFVKKFAVNDMVSSRDAWVQWTDAFYKIESNSYIKTVANIYRRMFNVAHEKMELTALNAVKFNDIIPFKYVFMKDFHVLNCTWNLDLNRSTLVLGRSIYKEPDATNPDGTNIPPIVEAGDPIYISNDATTVNLSATAYDPDGFIVSQVWTQTEGVPGAVMSDPDELVNSISGLTGDVYTFQILVTDNLGATAVDTVQVIREKEYVITTELVENVTHPNNPLLKRQKYKIVVTPELPDGAVINITGLLHLYTIGGIKALATGVLMTAVAWYNIEKNGALIEGKTVKSVGPWDSEIKDETIPLNISYVKGDAIYITIYVEKTKHKYDTSDHFKALSNFKLQTASLISGFGSVSGVPIEHELTIIDDE